MIARWRMFEVEKARKKFDEANAAAQAAEADAKVLNEQAQRVDEMKYDVLNSLEMLTLRTLPGSQLERRLVFYEPEWKISLLSASCAVVFGGWHLRY